MSEVLVRVAEYRAGRAGTILVTLGLGSCVAVALLSADGRYSGSAADPNHSKISGSRSFALMARSPSSRAAKASAQATRSRGRSSGIQARADAKASLETV